MSWRSGAWDFITIEGLRLNGQCKVFNVKQKRNLQATGSPGTDGPKLTDQGYLGSDVTIGILAWRERQFATLMQQLARIHPRQPGALKRPLSVEHPLASAFDIDKIVIGEVDTGMPTADGWLVTITAKQWFAQPKTTAPGSPNSGGSLVLPGVPEPSPANLGPSWP